MVQEEEAHHLQLIQEVEHPAMPVDSLLREKRLVPLLVLLQ